MALEEVLDDLNKGGYTPAKDIRMGKTEDKLRELLYLLYKEGGSPPHDYRDLVAIYFYKARKQVNQKGQERLLREVINRSYLEPEQRDEFFHETMINIGLRIRLLERYVGSVSLDTAIWELAEEAKKPLVKYRADIPLTPSS